MLVVPMTATTVPLRLSVQEAFLEIDSYVSKATLQGGCFAYYF